MAYTKQVQDLLARRITSPADFPSPPVALVSAWHNDSGGLLLTFSNGKFVLLSEYHDCEYGSDIILSSWDELDLAEFVSFGLITPSERLSEEQAEVEVKIAEYRARIQKEKQAIAEEQEQNLNHWIKNERERYRRIVAAISAERDED